MEPLLTRAAKGEWTERPPVWLMRQAGRHIPEYRDIRKGISFREAITDPEIATKITLLPQQLYDVDGLVIFSDILTALEPLGFEYHIESGVGPVIENPVTEPADIDHAPRNVREELAYVAALLDNLTSKVNTDTALIGFAGGPFTLASYIVAGEPTRNHEPLRQFRVKYPDAFEELLAKLAEVVRESLQLQIDHGADVVQLFDTYGSVLSPRDYEEFILPAHQEILADLDVPTIIFVRNMNGRLQSLKETGADVISLDWTVDIKSARDELGSIPVQGNLDPQYLFGDTEFIKNKTQDIIEAAGPEGHILNLGHGVHKDTPVKNVRTFVEIAKSMDRSR